MTYQQTLDYLYSQLPMFQRVGAVAYKKDLTNTIALCKHLGHPQHAFKSVHIAGTNGKGSSSHMLAAIFQQAGYKTGLYTSPHLKSFTERIRINGNAISEQEVIDFVAETRATIELIKPSFFETTVAMAFNHFAKHQVDIAIIEVGLGGRLDSTNVIVPELSLITNISFDHQALLGNTLVEIAGEKAGIIKPRIPVVISETQVEIREVFILKAKQNQSDIHFADQDLVVTKKEHNYHISENGSEFDLSLDLLGDYQRANLAGVWRAAQLLKINFPLITNSVIIKALAQVQALTGLKGRWQVLQSQPLMICDTGHNQAGISLIINQIKKTPHRQLHFVMGVVNDKSITPILSLLPKDAYYYFCQAQIPRALLAQELASEAEKLGLDGVVIEDVNKAIKKAQENARDNDLIFIGGSTFVVAEIENL